MTLVNKNESRQMYEVEFKSTSGVYYAVVESPSPHLVKGMASTQLADEFRKQPEDFLALQSTITRTSSFKPSELLTESLKDIRRHITDNVRAIIDGCVKEEYKLYYPPNVPMFRVSSGECELLSVKAMDVANMSSAGFSVAGTIKNACTPVRTSNG